MKDRIIIWESGDLFTFLLANSLQDKYDAEIYAIIDTTDRTKKFFENQKFVKFEKVWFYYDHIFPHKNKIDIDYLKSFEKKYNVDLWILAQNERLFNQQYNDHHKFSTKEILAILEDECKLFEKILDETNPNFLITTETYLHHHHLFYLICRSRGVKVMMLNQSKFGYKCIISQEIHKLDFVDDLTNESHNRNYEELQKYHEPIFHIPYPYPFLRLRRSCRLRLT